jgi:hypothetical protein
VKVEHKELNLKTKHVGGQCSKVKSKHVKKKKLDLKTTSHLQNLDDMVETRTNLINKIDNERFRQFLYFHWVQQLRSPMFYSRKAKKLQILEYAHQPHI